MTRIWTLDGGEEVARLSTPDLGFSSRLGPRGSLVVGLPDPDRTEVWDIRSGRRVATVDHEASSWRPILSPDLRLVAIKRRSELLLHALPSGEPVGVVEIDPELTIDDVAFSPDSRWVAVGGEDRAVTVEDPARGVAVAVLSHEGVVDRLAFTADGGHLVSHAAGGPARLFSTSTWQEVARLGDDTSLVALATGAMRVATAGAGRTVRVWDVPSGRLLREVHHDDDVQRVSLRPRSDVLAIAGRRTVTGVSVEDGRTLLERRFLARVTSFARSESGRYVAVGLSDGDVESWDLETRRGVLHIQGEGAPADVERVTFSADGRRLVTVGEDAHLWDLSDGSEIARVSSPDGPGAAAALSPDGKRLAVGGSSANLTVWDLAPVEPVMTARHDNWINSVAFSPDGRLVATAGPPGGVARIWRVDDGANVRTLAVDARGGLLGVAFHPDGRRIMTTGRDGSVRFWNLDDGAEVGRFLQGTAVVGLDITRDGRFMATSGTDQSARVWDLEAGRLVGLVPHGTGTRAVALSGDGAILATVTREGTLALWRMDRDGLLTDACQRLSRNLTWDEWRQYQPDRPYRKTCPGLPLHRSFVQAAFQMAQGGDPEGARRQLGRALELEPGLDLDVDGELQGIADLIEQQGVSLAEREDIALAARRFEAATRMVRGEPYDYEARARALATREILETGVERALDGDVEGAKERFAHATALDPSLRIPATAWNSLCWFGVVHGRADDVLDACDRAVELAGDDMRGFFADSRGVGRWAVGDTAGAVADFETFLGWASGREPMADLAAERRRWIDALRSGADPLEGSSLPAHGNELAPFRMELGLVWQLVTIE